MTKCRDMERQIDPRSQMFTQGGIRTKDWFSDRLCRTEKEMVRFQSFVVLRRKKALRN